MNKDNAIKDYLRKVPEIQEEYIIQCKENLIDDTDGAHAIWSLGLVPCLIKLIKEHKTNDNVLVKTFNFFEEMATSPNEEVRELLLYSVLEQLGDDKEILNTAMSLMGENTLRYSEQVENFLGR